MKNSIGIIMIMFSLFIMSSCGGGEGAKEAGKEEAKSGRFTASDPMDNVGIGPIKELVLPSEIDQAMAERGKAVYSEKCTACHKADKKYIGPSPMGIFERRNPAWVMNMILNPEEMVEKDPIARQLLVQFNGSPMANQNLTEEEARSVVEYFRTL